MVFQLTLEEALDRLSSFLNLRHFSENLLNDILMSWWIIAVSLAGNNKFYRHISILPASESLPRSLSSFLFMDCGHEISWWSHDLALHSVLHITHWSGSNLLCVQTPLSVPRVKWGVKQKYLAGMYSNNVFYANYFVMFSWYLGQLDKVFSVRSTETKTNMDPPCCSFLYFSCDYFTYSYFHKTGIQ